MKKKTRRYYTNIVGKYGPQVQNAIRKVSGLEIKRIAPTSWSNLAYT